MRRRRRRRRRGVVEWGCEARRRGRGLKGWVRRGGRSRDGGVGYPSEEVKACGEGIQGCGAGCSSDGQVRYREGKKGRSPCQGKGIIFKGRAGMEKSFRISYSHGR